MTHNRTADYWISPNALRIERNAMSLPDYIQASCTSGAKILCYIKDIITYDDGHNYRSWSLIASPTAFTTHTEKYIYVAIPRDLDTSKKAQVVFPSEYIDIYGKAEHTVDGTTTEEQMGSTDYYYIFLQGILSSSGDNGTTPRDWTQTVDTGTLSSDEAINTNQDSEWYQYSAVDQITTFLKDLTMKAGTKFYQLFAQTLTIVSGGKIKFGTDEGAPYVSGIATSTGDSRASSTHIVTPKYMDDNALSKAHNDTTPYDLTMKNLRTNGTADIFGNVTIHDGASLSFGTFNTGLTGGRIQSNGDAELKSLVLRESLTVPKLVYNRVEVMAGNTWRGPGGGEILTATPDKDAQGNTLTTGTAILQLEEGEIGMVAVGDICQGIFHLMTGNDTKNEDNHNGNFHFAGFKTIYFEVTQIVKTEDNSQFRYKLRSATDTMWTDNTHPQPHMNFAVYGNRTDKNRQSSAIDTTQYHLLLAGVTSWTYGSSNIQYIEGYLNGFTIQYTTYDSQGQETLAYKYLSGYGVAIGNMYQWGSIDQFDRAPTLISQQLYYLAYDSSSTPSLTDQGWSTTVQSPTKEKPYLWQYYLQTLSDSSTKPDGPFLAGRYSENGTDAEVYTIIPSVNAIKSTDGVISPQYISARVFKTKSGVTSEVTIDTRSSQDIFLHFCTENSDWRSIDTMSNVYVSDCHERVTLCLTPDRYYNDDGAFNTVYAQVTIPIVYDGSQGLPGDNGAKGDDGNGIESTTLYRMTSMTFEAPETDSSDWIASTSSTCPTASSLTNERRYLWQKKVTTYTKTSTPTTEISLLAQFYDGIHENLLEQTPFQRDMYMDKWDIANGDIVENVYQQHNGYSMSPNRSEAYKDMLRQIVYKGGSIGKLKPSTWYTLSFYGAMTVEDELLSSEVYNGMGGTSLSRIEKAGQEFYIASGQTVRLKIRARVASAKKVYMRIYLYWIADEQGNWGAGGVTKTVKNATVSGTTLDFTFTNTTGADRFFRLDAFVYLYDENGEIPTEEVQNTYSGSYYRGHIFSIKICRGSKLLTSLSRSDGGASVMNDGTIPWYVDGVKVTSAQTLADGEDLSSYPLHTGTYVSYGNDASVLWQMALEAKRHTITFRTPDTLDSSAEYAILFRMSEYANWGWISMPKLEENTVATEWCSTESDKTGLEGCVVRRSEWEAGKQYRNDSALTPSQCQSLYGDSTRYIDEVCYTDLTTGTPTWKLCRISHTAVAADGTEDSTTKAYKWSSLQAWQAMNSMSPVRTSFADIAQAFIQYLQVNQISLVDSNGKVYGAFGKNSSGYPLWFGGETIADAVTKFGENGDADIRGTLHARAIYTMTGQFKTQSGLKYIDLDNNPGNTYVVPASDNVYLPDPTNYEGITITLIFGANSGVTCTDGIFTPYYTTTSMTSTPTLATLSNKCIFSTEAINSVILQSTKAYGANTSVRWVVVGQRGVLELRNSFSGDKVYDLCPDGRLIVPSQYGQIPVENVTFHDSKGTITVDAEYFRKLNAFAAIVKTNLNIQDSNL